MGKEEDTSFEPSFSGVREPAVSTAELSGIEQKLGANQRLRIQVPTANTLLQLGYKGSAENGFQAGISALTDEHVFITSRNSTVTVIGDKQVLFASKSGHLFAQANESTFVGAGNTASVVGGGGAFVGGGVEWSPVSIDETAGEPDEHAFPAMGEVQSAESEALSSANNLWTGLLAGMYSLGLEASPIDALALAATWGAYGIKYAQGGETMVYGKGAVNTVTPGKVMTMGVKTSILASGKAMMAGPMVSVGGGKAELLSATKTTMAGGAKAAVVSGMLTEIASGVGKTELLGDEIEVGTTHPHPPQVATNDVNVEAKQKVAIESENYVDVEAHNYVNIIVGDFQIQVHKDRGVRILDENKGQRIVLAKGGKIEVHGKDAVEVSAGSGSGTLMRLDSDSVQVHKTTIDKRQFKTTASKVLLG